MSYLQDRLTTVVPMAGPPRAATMLNSIVAADGVPGVRHPGSRRRVGTSVLVAQAMLKSMASVIPQGHLTIRERYPRHSGQQWWSGPHHGMGLDGPQRPEKWPGGRKTTSATIPRHGACSERFRQPGPA